MEIPTNIAIEYGIPVAIIALVLKFVLDFVNTVKVRKTDGNGQSQKIFDTLERILIVCERTHDNCAELQRSHNIQDKDGVPRWYVKEELVVQVREIHEAVNQIKEDLRKLNP